MAKTGYRFNPETLSYDRIHVSVKKKLWSLVVKFFSSLSLALVIFLIVSAIVDSPKEKALKREKEEILAQYHILNNELERMDEVLKNWKPGMTISTGDIRVRTDRRFYPPGRFGRSKPV